MNRYLTINHEEIEAIHQATLRILEEVGVIFTHPEGIDILTGEGASASDGKVYLPHHLVERCLASRSGQVPLQGRDGVTRYLGDGHLHWHNLGGAREVYEPKSRTRRAATVQDVRDSARLLDALEGVTMVTPFFTPQDVPGQLMALGMYRYSLPHTTKPLHGPGVQNAFEVSCLVHMAEVIGEPDQVLSLSVSPISPLTFPDEAVGAIIAIARAGLPFGPLPCPIAGATAPISLAGALTQQNAEVLASLVLAECTQPGLPIFYCGRLAFMEPRTGLSVWGGAELGLASAATVQIAHYYGLPVNVYGLSTNAHEMDLQSGSERSINALLPALAGADELSGIGELGAGVMGCYAQMVLDSEIAAGIRRIRRGFDVDQDSLAVDTIGQVMQGERNFLAQRHTVRYLRAGEILNTRLAERRPWEGWMQDEKQGMVARAMAEAEHLLAEHSVPPLDSYQEEELDAIMHKAAQDFAGIG